MQSSRSRGKFKTYLITPEITQLQRTYFNLQEWFYTQQTQLIKKERRL